MELSIQERLKDLRVERGLTLEQLAEETKLSKSALGSYEADDLKDISHYALIKLAKFYEVTTDYILGRSKNRNHPNADLADLRLSNEQVVRSNRISSSKVKSPKSGFTPDFSGIFIWLRKCPSRGMWALIALISRKVFQKGGSRGGAKRGEKQEGQPKLAQDFLR